MAEDRVQLGQLTQALAIENNALFPYSQEVSGTQTTFGAPMSQIATKVAEGTTFSTLATTSKNLVGAINELQAGGGGGSSHSYSTDEQEVGTWIDGSKVYEKTVYAEILGSYNYDTGINNIKIISFAGGVCDEFMRGLIPFGYGSNVNVYCNGEKNIIVENGYISSGRNRAVIIYRYMKP